MRARACMCVFVFHLSLADIFMDALRMCTGTYTQIHRLQTSSSPYLPATSSCVPGGARQDARRCQMDRALKEVLRLHARMVKGGKNVSRLLKIQNRAMLACHVTFVRVQKHSPVCWTAFPSSGCPTLSSRPAAAQLILVQAHDSSPQPKQCVRVCVGVF